MCAVLLEMFYNGRNSLLIVAFERDIDKELLLMDRFADMLHQRPPSEAWILAMGCSEVE